ncbi:MAG: V-type ATP synthase subunit I [Bacteroidaceae bacterium]|nr:V-type ATP synthase subunit I [Bacteroidaceae bacterium]
MIEKMKKLTFLVYHREYEDFLHRLQDLGVMHVVTSEVNPQQSETISGYVEQIKQLTALQKEMKTLLAAAKDLKVSKDLKDFKDLLPLTARFEHLADLRQQDTRQQAQLTQLEPWGDFDPELVQKKLSAAGCELQFYVAPAKVFKKEIEGHFPVMAVSEMSKNIYFVLVAHDEESELPATHVSLPAVSLSKLQAEHEALTQELEKETEFLTQLSQENLSSVEEALRVLNAKMQFDTVKEGTSTAAADHLMVLNGWFPAVKQTELEQAFSDDAAWYEISNPTPDDDIPICLKNNRFFRLFEMITKLYMLPKYNELDLTPFFAPFYIVFFGLCLGDSGYGLFITVAVLLTKLFVKNMSDGLRAALNLLLTMGISAFVFGFLSGAFFGFNLYDPKDVLNTPFFDKIGAAVSLDNSQMFNLSLILGFIQIVFGMILKVVNKAIQFGARYSVSSFAWLLVVLSGAVIMFLPQYASIAKWVAIAAMVMAFCYNSPDAYKKPLTALPLNIGLGLWDAYNMATGMLGDMLSYIRLFALGLSGGIVASVFNSLAAGFAPDNIILGPLVMIIIFVFGHALNMFMNVLGAFVHPMRLTFVEFFKNSGYEGGGLEYTPFKR